MEASASNAAATNPGAAKVKRSLLAGRSRIQADSHALIAILGQAPVAGQPAPDTSAAIAQLNTHLKALHAAIQRESGGGAKGKAARRLTAQTIADIQASLDKLSKASSTTDPAAAVKLMNEGLRLLAEAKKTSRTAGKALGGTWPL